MLHRLQNKKYNKVKFEISEANTYQLIEKLNSNLIDIAVVIVFAIVALSLLFTSGKKTFAMMEV